MFEFVFRVSCFAVLLFCFLFTQDSQYLYPFLILKDSIAYRINKQMLYFVPFRYYILSIVFTLYLFIHTLSYSFIRGKPLVLYLYFISHILYIYIFYIKILMEPL